MSLRPATVDYFPMATHYTRITRSGVVSRQTVYSTVSQREDTPLNGVDGNFVNTTPYGVRYRILNYPQGRIGGRQSTGTFVSIHDNLQSSGFRLTSPTGFGNQPPTSELTSLKSKAILAAIAEMKAQAANLLVFYAERMEAGALLLGLIGVVVKSLKALRSKLCRYLAKKYSIREQYSHLWKGVNQRRRKIYKSWFARFWATPISVLIQKGGKWATARWLEYVFGVRPLVAEASGIIDRFKNPIYQSVKVVKTRTHRVTVPIDQEVQSGAAPGLFLRWSGKRKLRQSVRATLRAEVSAPGLASAAQLGLLNPISAAWELIPFSWVVDTFWPIGSWLESLDADIAWNYDQGSCVTTRAVSVGIYDARLSRTDSSWSNVVYAEAKASEKVVQFSRGYWEHLAPFPSLNLPSAVPLVQLFSNLMSILVQSMEGTLPRGARV